jgi:Trk-type K+ transport system membrane component
MEVSMRKVQVVAVAWTMFLAIPLTVLALSGLAYITDHIGEIVTWVTNVGNSISIGGRGFAMEFAGRWPEIAGMIVGQIVIMIILLMVKRDTTTETGKEK